MAHAPAASEPAANTAVDAGALETGAPAVDAFRRRISASGNVVFRSHDGKALRRDSDFELIFHRDAGRVDLLFFGFGLMLYQGEYAISADGKVTLTLSGERAPRLRELTLHLQRPGGVLLLLPTSNGSEVAEPSDHTDFWRFRMLTGDDERGSLDDLAHMLPRQRPPRTTRHQ
jgi:hypothetical protein